MKLVNTRYVIAAIGAIALCQALLFAPSMLGHKILAPTDILLSPGFLSNDPASAKFEPQNRDLFDVVDVFLPWLDFAAYEVRAGRLPLWNPHIFCGVPFLANNQSALFSPFTGIYYLWPSPYSLVWMQLARAIIAGLGAYCFFAAIGLRRSSALVGAICFPLCGYLILWINYPLSSTVAWLPWCFWGVEKLVQDPRAKRAIILAGLIAILMLAGQLEIAAYLLLAVGIYGVTRWCSDYQGRLNTAPALRVVGLAIVTLLLGFSLAAIQLIPTAAYVPSGFRAQLRRAGTLEAELAGGALPELVRVAFPYALGSSQAGSRTLISTPLNEGGANAYAGWISLAVMAPLALRRLSSWGWLLLALFFAAPVLQIPILGYWHWFPPFSAMQPQRALVVTGWCILVLGIRGFDTLDNRAQAGWLGALSVAISLAVAMTFAWLAFAPSAGLVERTTSLAWPWFRWHYSQTALIAAIGCAVAIGWWLGRVTIGWLRAGAAFAMIGELFVFAYGFSPQCDPKTYYPPSAMADELGRVASGRRITGQSDAFPPNLAMKYGLREMRGYDGVDPLPFMELVAAANPGPLIPQGSVTMYLQNVPSPLVDLIGVQAIVSGHQLNTTWPFVAEVDGFYIYKNETVLPRVFVPRRVDYALSSGEVLAELARNDFDPRELAFVDAGGNLPTAVATGAGEVVSENCNRVELTARVDREGLVVLADAWAPGWQVKVDGEPAQAMCVDHALRGVFVSGGEHRVEWIYRPLTVVVGGIITLSAIALAAVWSGLLLVIGMFRKPSATIAVE